MNSTVPLGDWQRCACRKVMAAWSGRVLLGLGIMQERQKRPGCVGRADTRRRSAPAHAAARRGAARHGAARQDHLENLPMWVSGARSSSCMRVRWPPAMVAAFVRQNADQLVGRLGPHDQAGIDEDPLRHRHEGVGACCLVGRS